MDNRSSSIVIRPLQLAELVQLNAIRTSAIWATAGQDGLPKHLVARWASPKLITFLKLIFIIQQHFYGEPLQVNYQMSVWVT
ncbi:MAG: hypothetical protein ACKO34_01450 [Vampirovibrionales bacterium]